MAYYSHKMAEWAWTLDSSVQDVHGQTYSTTWIPKVTTKLCEPLFDIKFTATFDGKKWHLQDGREYDVPEGKNAHDWKPPCPLADSVVAAYNGNMMRESGINHYRNECLVIANNLEADGHNYYADQLRKLVDVVKEMTEEAKPSEAVIAEIGEAADGLD